MADQINVSPNDTRERVVETRDSTGWSAVMWVLLVLVILGIAYFLFSGQTFDRTENNINVTPGEQGTTEQQGTTDNTGNTNSDTNTGVGTDTQTTQ